jgi:hypothetical protein
MSERVTPYRFAKLRGIPQQTVYGAIRRGLISVGEDGKLDPDEALQQWDSRSHSRAIRGARSPKLRVINRAEDTPSPVSESEGTQAPTKDEERAEKHREWTSMATEARARKDLVEAERSELRLRVERGELVDRKDVEKDGFELYRAIRESLMALPDRLAAQLAAFRDPADVHYTLDAEIRAILENFADKAEQGEESVA